MVRSMMSYSDLPSSFYGRALETANYVLNLVPSKSVPLTPTELWTGRKPSLRHIRVWGCPAHVLKGKMDKLEAKMNELSKGMETQSSEKQSDQMQTPKVDFDIPLHFSSERNVNRLNVPQEQVPEVILPQSSGSYVEQTAQQEEVVDIPVDSMETQVLDDDVVQPQNQNDVVATDVVCSRSGR
ncbi:uncharacterized protein LOC142174624 [Nicotiana tabacum]|uniref:Uncharacterized protein LOC142174624 n=1 Tax=Nicotiana tabacum TaxID=4097 RepID=A0AC58TH49_TOBAC